MRFRREIIRDDRNPLSAVREKKCGRAQGVFFSCSICPKRNCKHRNYVMRYKRGCAQIANKLNTYAISCPCNPRANCARLITFINPGTPTDHHRSIEIKARSISTLIWARSELGRKRRRLSGAHPSSY